MPAETVDGMSVVAVRAAAGRAVAHARAGGGPYFLEAITYRYVGHSRSDPGAYRPPASSTPGRSATRSRGSAASSWTPGSIRRSSTRSTARSRRCSRRWSARASRRRSRSPGRQRSSAGEPERPADAAPLGLDERGDDRRMAEAARRGVPPRRAAGRGRDRQGDRRLRGRGGRRAGRDPRARGRGRGARRADRPARRGDGDDASRAARRRASADGRMRRRGVAAPAPVPAQAGRRRRVRGRRPSRAGPRSQLGVSLPGSTARARAAGSGKLDVVRAGSLGRRRAGTALDLKGPTTVVELSTTGQTIARRMTQSRSEIPSFDVVVQADMSTIVAAPPRTPRELVETVPSVNDFVVKAAALALREYPAFNSSFVDGRSERHGRVNVGIAVATEDALLVPAVVDADLKPLAAIAAETRELAARAQRPAALARGAHGLDVHGLEPGHVRRPLVHRGDQPRRSRSSRSARSTRSPVETADGRRDVPRRRRSHPDVRPPRRLRRGRRTIPRAPAAAARAPACPRPLIDRIQERTR